MLSADPGLAFGLGGPLFLTDVGDAVVEIGPDDHMYVAGSFRSTVDFDPGPGTANLTTNLNAQDGFVAKYTLQGGLLWVKQFGQAVAPVGVGNEFATAIDFDQAGNLYVSGWTNAAAPRFGSTTLTGQGTHDAFVTKIDSATGTFLWARGIGGAGDDRALGMNVSDSGDVYVTGSFQSTVDFDPNSSTTFNLTSSGESDAYVWKLDTAGNFVWARQFISGAYNEFGHRVLATNDGAVYAVGTFRDTTDFGEPGNPLTLTAPKSDDADIYIVKLEEVTGNSVWARQATGPDHINAARLLADGEGNIYVAGGFENTVSFGPGTPTLTSDGVEAIFISKWDAAGSLAWAEAFASGSGDVSPRGFHRDASGNLYFVIRFEGTVDFDPGPLTSGLTSVGGSDGAVVKLDSNGALVWVRHVAGPGTTWADRVVTDSTGNVYVTGFYEYSVNLPTGHVITNPGTGLTYQPGNGQFVMKLAFGEAPTKFYVVDDAATNQSYEYDAAGATNGNNSLNTSNSAPRGAASTAAGNRVWVVDANRNVFVYDINSNILGSWTAGTMASNATPEGIATNGTDVWIVDSKSDKVYKYVGAASRLSGSQNAASSFNLNSSNRDPKDIVTDGASLWSVNDSSTDKVFKYNLAGGMLGSWTIGSANSKPTGLTIDPSNVSDIWIVDSGTDRVYQYVGAASRISGSQAAAVSFALAAGNTNPQGIADPPSPFVPTDVLASKVLGPRRGEFIPLTDKPKLFTRPTVLLAREYVFETFDPERKLLSSPHKRPNKEFSTEFRVSSLEKSADAEGSAIDVVIATAFASYI